MKSSRDEQIRQTVRKTYGQIAKSDTAGCSCGPSSSCGEAKSPSAQDISARMGYSKDDVTGVPEGANMGLGCGNPQAIASLQPGETVLDLGSGGGFDCFLAAKAVGDSGHVIGIDMTAEMVSKARENAVKAKLPNVEFRLGEIEHLPVADNSVDVIISNCVINLSPEKPKVFKEAFRILKQSGRIAVADIVATAPLPEDIKKDLELHAGCVAGAAQITELESMLKEAGFTNIRIKPVDASKELIREWTPGRNIEDFIVSANIEAIKP
ncbi:MAG: arsenite methyltransferase [Planctomycetota bacterium]|jgi:SAM-dependent methyltransferase